MATMAQFMAQSTAHELVPTTLLLTKRSPKRDSYPGRFVIPAMSQNRWNDLPQPDRSKSFQINQGGHPVLPPPQALAQASAPGDREQFYLPSIQNQAGNMRYPLPSIRENVGPYMGGEMHQGMPRIDDKNGQMSPQLKEEDKPQLSAQGPPQGHPQSAPQSLSQHATPQQSQQQLTPQQQQQAPQPGVSSMPQQPMAAPQQSPQQTQEVPQGAQGAPQQPSAQPAPPAPSAPPAPPAPPAQGAQGTTPQATPQPQQAQVQPPASASGQAQTTPQPAPQQPQQPQPPLPGQGPQPQQQPPFDFQYQQYGQVVMPQPMFPPADYRPLNVRDALSYLEKVKVQFAKQPDVYNHFLDIMKDFKSQAIDTPGVIDRVSSLFRGHTNLIQGFNTFLPAGYRIECSLDPLDPNPIRVTTPMGANIEDFERWRFEQAQMGMMGVPQGVQGVQGVQGLQGVPQVPQPQPQPQGGMPGQPMAMMPQMQPQQPPQQAPPQEGMNQLHAAAVERQSGPAEFNYVFSYVNKIKKHFASQPDIYNSFLEILQAYKREQLRISEVYAQVKQLFGDAPDLLEDFQHFLPNRSIPEEVPASEDRLPPVGSFSAPQAQAQAPPPQAPQAPPQASMAEELSFFDKVRKALPKQTYLEFLKVINLFSQRIIDLSTLVERVDGFIGQQPELIDWFKQFVGWEGKPLAIENIAARKHVVDLSQCRSCGPSYRLLPKSQTVIPSSGRDEMCWEVLNDEWVGHPTWASEDSGIVAHRKNQYEEILYRIEEERHDYDHFIGSNQRTIQVLETIANRIANMTLDEQQEFKLPPGLGQKSKIYQKVINKIYDKKNGADVIDALHNNPAVAVPVILRRLKQKDEEWKRAQREWNKVWRETEQKVFYKSLDHIGLTFKQADRKQLTARAIVGEIVAVKAELGARRKTAALPLPKSQISFKVGDQQVLKDCWKLMALFIEHGGNFSQSDRELMNNFLRGFMPLFFGLDQAVVEAVYPGSKRPAESGLDSVLKRTRLEPLDDEVDSAGPSFDAEALAKEGGTPWLKFERGTPPLEEEPAARQWFSLFGNTTIYLFMRLLQTLYERLSEVKSYEQIVRKELEVSRTTAYAKELHLYDTKLEKLGLLFAPENCYDQALALCVRQIEGDLEPQLFEEALRQAYRNRAYKLYTVDKTLNALVKQLHVMVIDQTCNSVLLCYENDRTTLQTDVKRQILYRMQVRQLLGPEETMFRIDWCERQRELSFQHLGSSDLSLKGVAEAQKKWDYYVTSYMMSVPTEGIPFERIKPPLLSRNSEVVTEANGDPFAVISQGLSARICMNTYKLFFEPGSCDYIVRVVKGKREAAAAARADRLKRWTEIQETEGEPSSFSRWLNGEAVAPEAAPIKPEDVPIQESNLRGEPTSDAMVDE